MLRRLALGALVAAGAAMLVATIAWFAATPIRMDRQTR